MNKLNYLDWTSIVLVIVGGLNWALIGLFKFDIVAYLLGDMSIYSRIVYVLVGLAAVYLLAISMMLERK